MTRRHLAILAVLLALALPAAADRNHSRGHHRDDRDADGLGGAVERVERESGGRALSARTHREEQRSAHRVKVLLPSGRIRTYEVPADGERDHDHAYDNDRDHRRNRD